MADAWRYGIATANIHVLDGPLNSYSDLHTWHQPGIGNSFVGNLLDHSSRIAAVEMGCAYHLALRWESGGYAKMTERLQSRFEESFAMGIQINMIPLSV